MWAGKQEMNADHQGSARSCSRSSTFRSESGSCSDGTIWFTDPSYGIDLDHEGQKAPSELGSNNLYRVDAGSGDVVAAASDFVQPNGLAFSMTCLRPPII